MSNNLKSRRNFLINSSLSISALGIDFSIPSWLLTSGNTEGFFSEIANSKLGLVFIREKIDITQIFIDNLVSKIPVGNIRTLTLAANTLTLKQPIQMPKGVNLNLYSDTLVGNDFIINMVPITKDPNAIYIPSDITIYTRELFKLNINSNGESGNNGTDGIGLQSNNIDDKINGKPGSVGGNAGNIYIYHTNISDSSLNDKKSITNKGGIGGKGGKGVKVTYCTKYGSGPKQKKQKGNTFEWVSERICLETKTEIGRNGTNGANGKDGILEIKKISDNEWANKVNSNLPEWAKYQLLLVEYYYRNVNNPSPVYDVTLHSSGLRVEKALKMIDNIIKFDPQNINYKIWRQRIFNGHTPLGFQRNIDINPDVQEFENHYKSYYPMVDSIQKIALTYINDAKIDNNFKNVLSSEKKTLETFAKKIEIDINQRLQVEIDKKQNEMKKRVNNDLDLDSKIENRKHQIANRPFTFSDFVSTVGAVVGVASAIFTGGATLLGASKSFMTLLDTSDAFLDAIGSANSLKDMKNAYTKVDPLEKNALIDKEADKLKLSFKDSIKQFNTNQKKVVNEGKQIFYKIEDIIDDIKGVKTSDAELDRLLALKVDNYSQVLVIKKDIEYLELDKSVAKAQIKEFEDSALHISQIIQNTNTNTENSLVEFAYMLRRATYYMDILSKYVFLTARSIEIVQFNDMSSYMRFDIGHVHPDLFENLKFYKDVESGKTLSRDFNRSWAEFAQTISLKSEYINFNSLSNWNNHILRLSFKENDLTQLKANSNNKLSFSIKLDEATLADKKYAIIEGINVAFIGAKTTNSFSKFNAKLFQSGMLSQRVSNNSIERQILEGRTITIPDVSIAPLQENFSENKNNLKDRSIFSYYELFIDNDEISKQGINLSNLSEIQIAFKVRFLTSFSTLRKK